MQTIRETIVAGFTYYHRRYGDESHKHQARSRANLVNDHIVDFANEKLATTPGVETRSIYGRRLFEINGQVLLHFKKLDNRKLSSNYPTLFALDYNKQLELPGIPPTLPRLIAGFVPSPDWSSLEGVYITCPQGNKVDWFIDLTAATQQLQPILLETTENEQLRVSRKRVRAKSESLERDDRSAQG